MGRTTCIIVKKTCLFQAQKTQVRPEILEKVWQLMDLLSEISKNDELSTQFALKGGTALNLFYFDAPRLSVDIDLNYVGSPLLAEMKEKRIRLEKLLEKIYASKHMTLMHAATAHADGKYQMSYPSVLNTDTGSLEVDLNYMLRVPLFETPRMKSRIIGDMKVENVQLVSYEEIIAGKLSALLNRKASRDIFDAYHVIFNTQFDAEKLKTAFLAYWVMEESHGSQIPFERIEVNAEDVKNKLRPVLRRTEELDSDEKCVQWATMAVNQVKTKLKKILKLSSSEQLFLKDHSSGKKLDFSLITQDTSLIEQLKSHPQIQWIQSKKAKLNLD